MALACWQESQLDHLTIKDGHVWGVHSLLTNGHVWMGGAYETFTLEVVGSCLGS